MTETQYVIDPQQVDALIRAVSGIGTTLGWWMVLWFFVQVVKG